MLRHALLALLLLALPALPASAASLDVVEGVIAAQVVDRAPADAAETFPATVGTLYCFTRIAGADVETTVSHVWYREGEEMSHVVLPVRSADWRTWSSKTILPGWTGTWKVEVLDAGGELIKTVTFTVN